LLLLLLLLRWRAGGARGCCLSGRRRPLLRPKLIVRRTSASAGGAATLPASAQHRPARLRPGPGDASNTFQLFTQTVPARNRRRPVGLGYVPELSHSLGTVAVKDPDLEARPAAGVLDRRSYKVDRPSEVWWLIRMYTQRLGGGACCSCVAQRTNSTRPCSS